MNENRLPPWLARHFPRGKGADRLLDRFQRLGFAEFDAKGTAAAWIDVALEYPDWDGRTARGEGRIYLPEVLRTSAEPVPLIHNAGYELDPAGAAGWLRQGIAVTTIRNHPLNPLGRGFLLDRAFLNAARCLGFVDNGRVGVNGGSAGGWMTLMVASSSFPLLWAMPDVPPIHWCYNADFIARNKARSGAPGTDCAPVLPFTHAVSAITDQNNTVFGMDFLSPEWLAFSPIGHLDSITCPVNAIFSTADMLVPINQVGKQFVRPIDPAKFPANFTFAFDPKTPRVRGAQTLLDALPKAHREVFVIVADPQQGRLGADLRPAGPARRIELPFSKDRQWTIVVLDEGAPEPKVGHLKYHWDQVREPFRRHWEQRGLQASQLTSDKLEHLMRRFGGEAWRPFRFRPGGSGSIRWANTLDWPLAEKRDVLVGLEAFVDDDDRAEHFLATYGGLPDRLQRLGFPVAYATPAKLRAHLNRMRLAVEG